MVQRTKLVIILLLIVMAGFLKAQEANDFVFPRLLSEAVLDVPSDIKSTAKTVIVMVEVKADSSASFVQIMDGKEELKPYVEQLIPNMIFSPAKQKGVSVVSTLSIKLTVRRSDSIQNQSTGADSLYKVNKATLYKWINRQRTIENRQLLFSTSQDSSGFVATQVNDALYSTNFYMMGLNNKPYLILKDGFIEPARLYYTSLSLQMLSSFRDITANEEILSFANDKYLYPAMCTDVYAGLGDYEFNFAKGQVYKNHLFGIKDFYSEFGFLVQNGWWQETISDQTSSRIFLSLPVKNTTLSFNMEKYDQNIPSTTLISGYYNQTLYSLAHKKNDIYVKWELPFLTIGWQTEKEILSNPEVINKQELDTGQLMLNKSFTALATGFDVTCQYNYLNEQPEIQTLYSYSKKSKFQGLLNMVHKHKAFINQDQLMISENGLEKADLQIGYNLSPKLGSHIKYMFYNGKSVISETNGLFLNSTNYSYPSVFVKSKIAAGLDWGQTSDINVKCNAGTQKIINGYPEIVMKQGVYNISKDCLFSDLDFRLLKRINDYTASWEQTFTWNQYQFSDLPEYIGQARFKLIKELKYSNALSAGLNLTGHSNYSMATGYDTYISGGIIADAWLGVKITDLFEFQLMMKNLNNNLIFGLSPNPRTIIGTIHWFYLN